MTNKVNFNVRLENDPTKLQEIAMFEKIVDQFKGSGTYLEMLFTDQLCEFVTGQIANDFSPAVDEYMNTENDELAAAVADARYWEDEFNKARRLYEDMEELAKGQIQSLKEMINKRDGEINELIARTIDLREQLDVSRSEAENLDAQIEDLKIDMDNLQEEHDMEIVALKAKMWDQMMDLNNVTLADMADIKEEISIKDL